MAVEFTMQTFCTMVITLGIIITNTLMILVANWTEAFNNINKIFFYSMLIADLCIGLFVAPFAMFGSFNNHWIYDHAKFCQIEAYLLAIFFIAGLYSHAWTSVDHYTAIRKPERYSTKMSAPRSLCWIIFAWVAAVSFCCPPLFSLDRAQYYREAYLCSIDTQHQRAYFLTAGTLVLCPALMALCITDAYLFTKSFQKQRHMCEHVLIDLASRPKNFCINFVVSIVFFLAWLPWSVLQLCSLFIEETFPPDIHFYFTWFGIGNSCYKFFVYLILSPEFRQGLKELCRGKQCACAQCLGVQSNLTHYFPAGSHK